MGSNDEYSVQFSERFREILAEGGRWRFPAPEEILNDWNRFVFLCEEGYDDNQPEYDNDISDRSALEKALNDPVLNGFAEIERLRREVHAADERFRGLLHERPRRDPASSPWWYAYVPRFAGRECAEDMHRMHGLNIRVVE